MKKNRPRVPKNRLPKEEHIKIMLAFYMKYNPLKAVYENENEYICFPQTNGEPLAVFRNKKGNSFEELFYYNDDTNRIRNAVKDAYLVYGQDFYDTDDDEDLSKEYEEMKLEEEFDKTLQDYIAYFGEDPHIGECTDVCVRPLSRLVEAMKRAIKRGTKLRHNEIYLPGGFGSFREQIIKKEDYKVLETEKYLYNYYPPECDEDEAKYLQINKETRETRWVNVAEDKIWKDLEKAKVIGYFLPNDPDTVIIKKRKNKK